MRVIAIEFDKLNEEQRARVVIWLRNRYRLNHYC